MLKIRAEQLRAFDKMARQHFEDEMVAHAKTFAPKQAEALGTPGLRWFVRLGLDRAYERHLTAVGSARLYVELMFLFGVDFHNDPQYPWAAEILGAAKPENAMAQAEWLHGQAMAYLQMVAGPNREFAIAAYQHFIKEELTALPGPSRDFDTQMLKYLESAHPEKYKYIGIAPLLGLVARAKEEAQKYGISSGYGPALLCRVMYSFGHGCTADPQFPWIGGTLKNPEIKDANTRTERLASKTKTYLEQALGQRA